MTVNANSWPAGKRETRHRRRARGRPCAEGWTRHRAPRGQGMVEFALLAGVLLFVAIGAIQMALIFNAVLSVSQLSYAGARYASVNSGMTSGNVASYMKTNLASPTINESSGADITVTLLNSGGATIAAVPASGTQFAVQVTYDMSNKVFLPATFFGYSLNLPSSVASKTAVMAE